MRQIFPLGDYVRRTGDTMTGPLIIKRDASSYSDGHLVIQNVSSGAPYLAMVFKNEAGTVVAIVRSSRIGHIGISPSSGNYVQVPGADISAYVNWYPIGFPGALLAQRVMMVESRLFGRR